jgi:hypothetical protein
VSAAQLEKLQATRLPLQGQPKSVCRGIASKSASPRIKTFLFLKKITTQTYVLTPSVGGARMAPLPSSLGVSPQELLILFAQGQSRPGLGRKNKNTMKTKPKISGYILRSAFYLLLLVAVCAIPFALAQSRSRGTAKRSVAKPLANPNSASQFSATAGGAQVTQPVGVVCLVVNGGFETDDFTGWINSGETDLTNVNAVHPHSGTYSEQTGPDTSDGFTDQTIATVAGTAYDVSFWLRNDDISGDNSFGASFGSVTLVPEAVQGAFGYTQYTFTNVVPGANADLHFIFFNVPDYFYLDDVCVTPSTGSPTPTPTATPTPTCPIIGDYTITTGSGTIVPGTTDTGNHFDGVTAVSLPFPVHFYDQTYSGVNALKVSSDGNIQFVSANNDFNNVCLPAAAMNNLIAPYWDDLYDGDTANGQGIFTSVSGTAPSRIFNIEFRENFTGVSGPPLLDFEVRLHEDTANFEIIFGTLNGNTGDSATVGAQRDTGSHFTQFECNTGGLVDPLQLNFTYAGGCASPTPTATATATVTPTPTPTGTPCTLAAPNVQHATNVTVSSFTAHWHSGGGGGGGATGYRLDVSTSDHFTTYVTGYHDLDVENATNHPVIGLSAGTHYFYRLRAYNGCATSRNSNVRAVQTTPCSPPAPDAQPATNVTASSFTAHWSSVNGAIDYRLDVSTSNTFTTYVSVYHDFSVGNMSSRLVTELSPHTTYYYRVRANNGCATSHNSNVRNVQTAP